jgi:hypothetical protein
MKEEFFWNSDAERKWASNCAEDRDFYSVTFDQKKVLWYFDKDGLMKAD